MKPLKALINIAGLLLGVSMLGTSLGSEAAIGFLLIICALR